jgi:hypothetical protein
MTFAQLEAALCVVKEEFADYFNYFSAHNKKRARLSRRLLLTGGNFGNL